MKLINTMTELQNIALLYESSVLMVEDAQARIEYLFTKYRDTWAKAIATLEIKDTKDPDWHSSFAEYKTIAYTKFRIVVERLDPTQGKYSEWYIRQMIKAANEGWFDAHWFVDIFALFAEDEYKVREILHTYDRIKHKLPVEQRDINKLGARELITIVKPFVEEQAELTKKELERKIKSTETLKLVDALNGWTVVVPLTMQSARLYGAHTQWCTAAKKDQDNAFEGYTKRGPILIFIGPEQKKYQWWYNFASFGVEPAGKYKSERYWAHNIESTPKDEALMFMDVTDSPVPRTVIPDEVWEATIGAMVARSGAQPTKEFLNGNIPYVQDDTPIDNFNNRMLYGAPVMRYYPDDDWDGVTETQREPEEKSEPYDATDGRNDHRGINWDDY